MNWEYQQSTVPSQFIRLTQQANNEVILINLNNIASIKEHHGAQELYTECRELTGYSHRIKESVKEISSILGFNE